MPGLDRQSIPAPLVLDQTRPISPGLPTDGMVDAFNLPSFYTEHDGRRPRASSFVSQQPSQGNSHGPGGISDIEAGTFVAFSLDRATISSHFPPDSKVFKYMQRYNYGRYIGLVTEKDDSDGSVVLVVHFVSKVTPHAPGTENHWIPIAPTEDHWIQIAPTGTPIGRTPLESNSDMFPFPNMKVWTTFGTRLRVQTCHDSTLNFRLRSDAKHDEEFEGEFDRFADHKDHDIVAQQKTDYLDGADLEWRIKCSVPDCTLPAEIWRDIRVAPPREDPDHFADEVKEVNDAFDPDFWKAKEQSLENEEDEVCELLAEEDVVMDEGWTDDGRSTDDGWMADDERMTD